MERSRDEVGGWEESEIIDSRQKFSGRVKKKERMGKKEGRKVVISTLFIEERPSMTWSTKV